MKKILTILTLSILVSLFALFQTVGINNNAVIIDDNGNLSCAKLTCDSISYNTIPARVSAYVSAQGNTTTTNAGEYYFLEATFTNEYAINFGFTGDTLQYQNGDYRFLLGGFFFSLSSNTNNTELYIAIYVNGSKIQSTEKRMILKTSGEYYPISSDITFCAMNNDKIKIVIKTDKAGAVITTDTGGSTHLHQIP